MKNLVLVTLMATIMMVGCGSEPVKPATLSPEGTETILQENILEENVIKEIEVKEIETWDNSSNIQSWD